MTIPVFKKPYKGDINELAKYVLEESPVTWSDGEKGYFLNAQGEQECSYYNTSFKLPDKYWPIIEDSLGYKIISDVYAWWHPPEIVEFERHIDNTPYTGNDRQNEYSEGNEFVGKYVGLVPIKGEAEVFIYENATDDAISSLKYSPGDVVFLAHSKFWHSVKMDKGKMCLHLICDKDL